MESRILLCAEHGVTTTQGRRDVAAGLRYNGGMNTKRIGVLVAATIAIMAGCVTTGSIAVSQSTENTIDLFLTGTPGEVAAIAKVPMLFDSEVLVRESDIRLLLTQIVGTSSSYSISRIRAFDSPEDAIRDFGSDFESRSIIERYSIGDINAVEVETDFGPMLLLLGDDVGSYRSIIGVAVK